MRRARVGAAAAALALLAGCLAACSGQASGTAHRAAPTPAPMAIDQDFPDPSVLATGGRYVLFATNSPAYNVQLATSRDLTTWQVKHTDALPELPAWAERGNTWAPAVTTAADGSYLMYYVARDAASQKQCIGVATSTTATGPYAPVGRAPLVCNLAEGGDIDPYPFTDADGARYLVWKGDGNCCGLDTWIQIARLSADGRALAGPPTRLIKQGQSWEGNLVEAPVLVRHGGRYVLFYSANDYGGDDYAIGWAGSASLLGPYTKNPAPLLSTASSHSRYLGPGGEDVVTTRGGAQYLVFHSWDPAYSYRGVDVAPLHWSGDTPRVG